MKRTSKDRTALPEYAARLIEARERIGLSRPQLAAKAGISFKTIAAWEMGIRMPQAYVPLSAIAKALNVTVEWILRGN